MKTITTFILFSAFLMLFSAANSFAQDYYPMHTGDTWYMGKDPQTITGKTVFDSLEYFKFFDSYYYHYERISNGDLYYKNNDTAKEYLYLKLNVPIGTKWQVNAYFKSIASLESKTDTIKTNDTVYYNCCRITFRYINVYDADYSIWLAPGVGIVRDSSLSWGSGVTISKALVDGKRIPSKILPPRVLKTVPYNFQQNVPVDVRLDAEFNFTLRKELVNQDNIKVSSKKSGNIKFHFDRSYGGSNFDIPFYTDNPLEYSDTVIVLFSKNLMDYMGDHLQEDYSFTFYTEPENPDKSIFSTDSLSQIPDSLGSGDFDLGDYDNDGDPDLVVFTYGNMSKPGFHPRLEIYNNGNSIFRKTDYSFNLINPGFYSSCVKWLDFNHDGWLDLVFAGQNELFKSMTQFYVNDKLSFRHIPEMDLGIGGAYVSVKDYNKDGYPDLAMWGDINNQSSNNLFVYKNSSGKFSQQFSILLPRKNIAGLTEWVDLNQDGSPDLIYTGERSEDTQFYIFNDGKFEPYYLSIDAKGYLSYHYGMDASDIDKDGDLDLILSGCLFLRDGNKFTRDTSYVKGFYRGFGNFYDFDYDGYDDLFITGIKYDNLGRRKNYIDVYRNNKGKMELFKDIRLPNFSDIISAKWADINKDGRPDLLLLTEKNFQILHNNLGTTPVEPGGKNISDFYLNQNYPNPFNPVTTISYGIPKQSYVEIKIYDMLGREISTLVNKEHNAGSYKIQFNASSLPSGIYIFTLHAGQYMDSKKLMILK